MSNMQRTKVREDARKKPVMVKHTLKDAYFVTAETGDVIRAALGEIPSKYKSIAMILQVLEMSLRGEITVELPKGQRVPALTKQPTKQAPVKSLEKETSDE